MEARGELVEALSRFGFKACTEPAGDGGLLVRVDVDDDRCAVVEDCGSHYRMDVYEDGRRMSTGSAATTEGVVAMILSIIS